jgi:hypothetical protein
MALDSSDSLVPMTAELKTPERIARPNSTAAQPVMVDATLAADGPVPWLGT